MIGQKASKKKISVKFAGLKNSISQERVIDLLIYAIQQYKKHAISLEALTNLAKMILTSKNIALSDDLDNILEEINSLVVVDGLLNNILYELTHK